jgi:hypothetical protein
MRNIEKRYAYSSVLPISIVLLKETIEAMSCSVTYAGFCTRYGKRAINIKTGMNLSKNFFGKTPEKRAIGTIINGFRHKLIPERKLTVHHLFLSIKNIIKDMSAVMVILACPLRAELYAKGIVAIVSVRKKTSLFLSSKKPEKR